MHTTIYFIILKEYNIGVYCGLFLTSSVYHEIFMSFIFPAVSSFWPFTVYCQSYQFTKWPVCLHHVTSFHALGPWKTLSAHSSRPPTNLQSDQFACIMWPHFTHRVSEKHWVSTVQGLMGKLCFWKKSFYLGIANHWSVTANWILLRLWRNVVWSKWLYSHALSALENLAVYIFQAFYLLKTYIVSLNFNHIIKLIRFN